MDVLTNGRKTELISRREEIQSTECPGCPGGTSGCEFCPGPCVTCTLDGQILSEAELGILQEEDWRLEREEIDRIGWTAYQAKQFEEMDRMDKEEAK